MSSLRSYLQNIEGSAPSIQGAAGALMKHYDRSPGVAVGEWRNALFQATPSQYLPLLYVANEVLQTSKRNRGNKFLEAFSPILGQSLIFVSSKSKPPTVDRIRRTVKIWAERRVFSIRYVNELIKGLEPYRQGGNRPASIGNEGNESPGGSRFSPVAESPKDNEDENMFRDNEHQPSRLDDSDNDHSDDEDDDDDDLFGNASKKLLKIDVDFDRAAATAVTKKRRRAEESSPKAKPRKRATLAASSLLELVNQVATQQQSFDKVVSKLSKLKQGLQQQQQNAVNPIDSLVGNELLQEYKKTLEQEQEIHSYRHELHAIAQTRRSLEVEALRYLPWLERALQQDKDDVEFSKKFRKQLELFKGVHSPTKKARDRNLALEQQRLAAEQERQRIQQEEEDRKKFESQALSKQTEAKPGMVWNRATGEYQYPNQEESWRD